MDFINLRARAKINLALDILGKREDGYHEMRMVMQTLRLHDSLHIKLINKPGYIKLASNLVWLPTDERNLVVQAAQLMIREYKLDAGIFIGLTKRIPVAAGLAGGSSDCAAALVGINKLFRLGIDNDKLMELGATLGADVPYCIMRGTALAEGIGERITCLAPMPQAGVLLIKPPFSVSTGEVFGKYRGTEDIQHPDIHKMCADIKYGDLDAICNGLGNVLESVTLAEYPVIRQLKEALLASGAKAALMSGSGPSVFGIFATKGEAAAALPRLREQFPKVKDFFVSDFFNIDRTPGSII